MEEFLQGYLEKHESPIGSNEALPLRILNQTIREDELEGECIDIALQHLKSCGCPDILNFAIVRRVTDEILQSDLSENIKENDSSCKTYTTSGIAHAVFLLIHAVCKQWSGALPQFLRNNRLPLIKSSDYGIKNTRRKMEDRHTVISNLNILLGLQDMPAIQWYGVYDGHGGTDASNYVAKQLYLKFCKLENILSNPAEALKSCIQQTDEEFCVKAKSERLRSGTTAVVAVIVERVLHVAWVGDSQAVLVKDGKAVTVMDPHKPEREDEKKRIEDMGGCVVWFGAWRVNGSLSVSRAIGDVDHKPYVSGEADTVSITLDGNEDFLCLACDGFWDVFNGDDLIRLVREHLRETKDLNSVANTLCMKAKEEGSTDNITIVVVFLRDDINMGNDAKSKDVTQDQSILNTEKRSSTEDNQSFNNNNNNNSSSSSDDSSDTHKDGMTYVQGQQLGLEEKQRIPHKLLVNFVRNSRQKKTNNKVAVIVTESSSHAKLTRSSHNPRLENLHPSPLLHRKDTRASLLSLSTVESVTELHFDNPKRSHDKKGSIELPLIVNTTNKNKENRRHSFSSNAFVGMYNGKPLGYRAPNVHTRGRTRMPYRTSLVVTCENGNLRSPSIGKGYARSLPEDMNVRTQEKTTNIAITNFLSPTVKPHYQKKYGQKNQHLAKPGHKVRRRSRSAV